MFHTQTFDHMQKLFISNYRWTIRHTMQVKSVPVSFEMTCLK